LVIDWGARFNGYASDLTRTFGIGSLEPELVTIYQVVLEANLAGIKEGHPGISVSKVDGAARSVIERSGYGQFFTHRTGHGIGLECHEEPYIYRENTMILTEGMVYTVEPGIYIPGKGGVRIEDDVLITNKGFESLSNYPKELRVLP
jgi:Xaa-Pro dipeptidase